MEASVLTGRRVVTGLVILAGIGLLAGYGMAMRARPEPTKVTVDPALDETTTGEARERLFVHVGGAVANPGLYELPQGARINDAIQAAGGTTASADVDAVNLAASVSDGDKVLVPEKGENGSPGAAAPAASPSTARRPSPSTRT